MHTITKIALSWIETTKCVHTTQELLTWVTELNQNTHVKIEKTQLEEDGFWFIDKISGILKNKNNSFFSIQGCISKDEKNTVEQPIIIQDEIGYLGIICKEINGVLHFLMQAKIEPGNINKIQLSPTIQATKSNFTQTHGGNKPAYLDYFLNAEQFEIIVDQIQSEQSSRFYKKRNRNIIIKIQEDIELLHNFKWFTLGQLKELMAVENLVNMDTRTVISCIPFSIENIPQKELDHVASLFPEKSLFNSIFIKNTNNFLPLLYRKINNYKMFSNIKTNLVSLHSLKNWTMKDNEFVCNSPYHFKLIFCNIEIEGREVTKWTQPLFEANGMATFGLFVTEVEDRWYFLVKLCPEIGSFDGVEIGPSVQLEAGENFEHDSIALFFKYKWEQQQGVLHNVILSEEGGRFYHEQNHNVIIKINKDELPKLPSEYMWLDFYTLNHLVQVNNCLNIQIRNLLSLLKVTYDKH
ncbi:MAG: NDP-hexose 2,3-dehydratase family protein [Brevinema sp.]